MRSIPESTYFHGNEINQFIHIQVPMDLVISDCFANVSGDAKILYGLLLNRTSLSLRNGWEDEKGRTYINYTVKNVAEDMHVSHSKASRLFMELCNVTYIEGDDSSDKGMWFGLIEKVRVQNKPSRIYVHKVSEVKRFIESMLIIESKKDESEETIEMSDSEETSGRIGQKLDDMLSETAKIQDVSEIGRRSSRKWDDGHRKNRTTAIAETGRPSSQKQDENNKDNIDNDLRNNQSYPSVNEEKDEEIGLMDKILMERKLILHNIEYKALVSDHPENKKRITELVDLMVEACVLMGDIEISGKKIPHELVVSRLEKFNRFIMESVLKSIETNTTKVKNVKQYLLAILYNAPVTYENQLIMEISHDRFHLWEEGD